MYDFRLIAYAIAIVALAAPVGLAGALKLLAPSRGRTLASDVASTGPAWALAVARRTLGGQPASPAAVTSPRAAPCP